MRRRLVALAVASLLTVAGCDAAFGSDSTRCKHGRDDGPRQEQPSSGAGASEDL